MRRELFNAQPLCVLCEREGRVTLATVRDHIINLADGGQDVRSNTQPLCAECHAIKTAEESKRGTLSPQYAERSFPSDLRPSRVPLTIVCGPPGSGKSTYVYARATANDVVIDFDRIMQRFIGGATEHHTDKAYLDRVLDSRNQQLRALATDMVHEHAWFIVTAIDPQERERWALVLGGEVVVMDTPLDECIRRINADVTREGYRSRMIEVARRWWAMNSVGADAGDQLVLA